jgi:hypothetical protein
MEFKLWKEYFRQNQGHFASINFDVHDCLSMEERSVISSSLQQFQKGESSEGRHLFAFAKRFEDPEYLECIRLFIREEQKHASVLAAFMHKFQIPLIKGHWVDGIFRWLRKAGGIQNTVGILLVAEIIAMVYYRALHNATESELLRTICLQILRDEEEHISFQCDLLKIFHGRRSWFSNLVSGNFQLLLMTGTTLIVWWYHKKVLRQGGYYFGRYFFETLSIFYAAGQQIKNRNSFSRRSKMAAA